MFVVNRDVIYLQSEGKQSEVIRNWKGKTRFSFCWFLKERTDSFYLETFTNYLFRIWGDLKVLGKNREEGLLCLIFLS